MSSITITRALSELKTIKSRIDKLRDKTIFISTKCTGQTCVDHVNETKSNWQAMCDLSARYRKLKFAIIDSNNKTMVTIDGSQYTISQALAIKDWILTTDSEILDTLRTQRATIMNEVNKHDEKVESNLQCLLDKSFGTTCSKEQMNSISESYRNSNKIKIIDPLKIDTVINEIGDLHTLFLGEIDFALSESNAITKILI